MDNKLQPFEGYDEHYNDKGFWEKVGSVAKIAGVKVVYAALLLYYVATSPNVPKADKAKIYGALGYFILPLDLIPDAVPIAGFTDDLAALIWALRAVWVNITPDIEQQAYDRLTAWFGAVDKKDLKLF